VIEIIERWIGGNGKVFQLERELARTRVAGSRFETKVLSEILRENCWKKTFFIKITSLSLWNFVILVPPSTNLTGIGSRRKGT
jgi:hypothetical protein